MKRVLILMSKTGGGHLASAEALQAVFAQKYSEQVQVTIVDLLMDHLPYPWRELPKSYGFIANRTPWLWGTLWEAGHRRWLAEPINGLTARLSLNSILALITHHRPDLVVSVHPLVQELTLFALQRMRVQVPYAIVVTDLASIHPLWFHPRADRCFVASEVAYQAGVEAGMSPQQLRLYGLPVRPIFSDPARPQAELRPELGMDPDLPAVLLVGGGEGIGRVAEIARAVGYELGRTGCRRGQMVVVCGRNQRLRSALSREPWPVPVQVHGFVTNMSDWMAACDCIVTKAGPGTIAESLIRGLPILLSGFIPGQEEGNVPFVVDHHVGRFVRDPEEIARQVCRWFGEDQEEMEAMAAQARRLANPNSTHDIVTELAELAGCTV